MTAVGNVYDTLKDSHLLTDLTEEELLQLADDVVANLAISNHAGYPDWSEQ